jgi:hypothetical protein
VIPIYLFNFAPAKVIKMIGIIVIIALIIAIAIAFLCIKVILRKNGSFSSPHIHDSEAMRQRGIHCVLDQDREMRTRSRWAVSEKSTR